MHESGETKRVRLLVRGALVWAIAIVIRLVYLQVIQHDELLRLAQQQQQQDLEIRVPRGTIRDSLGNTLAKSVSVDSVCVNPMRIPDPDVAARMLAGVLKIDADALRKKIAEAKEDDRGFLWVQRRISHQQSERLRSLNLDWIEFRSESRREYPNGQLASHAVGSVDFAENGNSGLEQYLNDDLEGTAGQVRVETDVKGRAYGSQTELQAIPAMDVTLTIDSRIQYVAEKELDAACERSHARSGSVVCLNARTGDILALANWPTFDPNEKPHGPDAAIARNDVAVTTPYEPGSVFKVITLSAALETTSLRPESILPCGSVLWLGSRAIHEHGRGYGPLSMADVLAKSSNIGAIQIAIRMGQNNLYEYVRRFGFGRETGVPLPSETPGMLRRVERWGSTSFASIAMGHEISVTAMQLAQACEVVASGGLLVHPRLVLKKQRPGEPPEYENVDRPVRILKPETAHTMRLLMEGVVLHGTGRAARLKGYTSGGKTGTAQIFDRATGTYSHHYNGSYMGFAPVTNPAIAMVVTLNGTSGGTAGYGGVVAAPVWHDVAAAALRILDVPKDLPDDDPGDNKKEKFDVNDLSIAGLDPAEGPELVSSIPPSLTRGSNPSGQALFVGPVAAAKVAMGPKVPDFQGKTMRDVLALASASGITVDIVGHGIARGQSPRPGDVLPAGEHVLVQFAR
jgi:cell division protein FtsI (penicillin-binding protein 3)